MTRIMCAVMATAVVLSTGTARADDATAILDKAIKALGGEENLGKAKLAIVSSKGTISFSGNDIPFTAQTTTEGMKNYKQEVEAEFNGNKTKFITVVAGDNAWRKFGDQNAEKLDKDAFANEKRIAYLGAIPASILPLKGPGFKIEMIPEEKVENKPAVGIKITPVDGKEFKLYFDKESGLPVREVAKVLDFMGNEYVQETTYSVYKDMGGIKKATKINAKRDGEKFLETEVTEFKVLDKVDPKTFTEPQ